MRETRLTSDTSGMKPDLRELCRAIPPASVTVAALGPVDTPALPPHPSPVSKPRKVEEPQATYAAKKPAKAASSTKPGPASTSDEAFKRVTDKIFTERKELLRKLAQ
ncbi:MAG: hypothetical protein QG602_3766 [Verrucomicrobiota bacterium]|nr:hypothetical protein [Verrucomicrobiota bacterium]